MEFLTPIFAAVGAAVASVPIVLHMLRRAPTQEMPFSLVRFLQPSQPKLTRRAKIEHWPLMLLRMLAILLIGLAFARPFLRQVIAGQVTDEAARAVTILVDRSASMRRAGIQEQVDSAVRDVVGALAQGDLLRVVAFSESSTQLLSSRDWMAASAGGRESLIEEVLAQCKPGWQGTHTGKALLVAAEELAAQNRERMTIDDRQIVLITDFQSGSQLDELKSGAWPAGIDVDLRTVTPKERGNVGVTLVRDRRNGRTRVRVTSAADTPPRICQLRFVDQLGNETGDAIAVDAIPGQRQSILLPAPDAGSDRPVTGIQLLGDDHDFDNTLALPQMENPGIRVAHIGSADRNDPETMRYYLQRALSGHADKDFELIDLQRDDGVLMPVPTDVQFAVATDAVPAELQESLAGFFARSGTLLAALPTAASLTTLQPFLPIELNVTEADVADYAMLGSIDFAHPLFSAFSDARFADFSTIRFWRHREFRVDEDSADSQQFTVIASFDSGLPALVEIPAATTGRLLLLATGWHPSDSQLALSTRFAPLLTRALELTRPAETDQLLHTVGDTVRPGHLLSTESWTVTRPDGTQISANDLLQKESVDGQKDDSDLLSAEITMDMPGRYVMTGTTTDDNPVSLKLITCVSPAESRTEPLPAGQLMALGIGVQPNDSVTPLVEIPESERDAGNLGATELEHRQKWWRWLLLAGLSCLLLEAVWAAAIARRALAEA